MRVLIVSILIAFFDQWSKNRIRCELSFGESIPVIPGYFNLCYVQNTGAAWGMLEGLNHWLVLFSVLMLAVLVRFRGRLVDQRGISSLAMGMMIGGITGNLIDRVRLSYVVDFLHFYAGSHHFPAFNVADAAICSGVGLYMIAQWIPARNGSPAEPRQGAASMLHAAEAGTSMNRSRAADE